MAAGSTLDELPGWARALLDAQPVGRLGLLDGKARPRVLPVTFAVADGFVWTAIDHKPKRSGEPARVRWLRERPPFAFTVDHYEDDWDQLAWVQLVGDANVLEASRAEVGISALSRRYPQYEDRPPGGPVIRLSPERALCWRAGVS